MLNLFEILNLFVFKFATVGDDHRCSPRGACNRLHGMSLSRSVLKFFLVFFGSFILFHSVCLFCLFIQLISITSVSSIILGMIRDDDSSRMIP